MDSKTFEKKLESSKEILEKLMNPDITLAQSVEYYKEGMQTLKDAGELLQQAKLEYESVKLQNEE